MGLTQLKQNMNKVKGQLIGHSYRLRDKRKTGVCPGIPETQKEP